jgi:hypothetical protein
MIRGNPEITPEQWEGFLDMLRKTPNVAGVARACLINPRTVYRKIDRDPEFEQAFRDAIREAVDSLRQVAFDVALGRKKKPVVSMGRVVMVQDEAGKMVPLEEEIYDGQMIRFLLAAHDDTYRPKSAVQTAEVIPSDLLPDPAPTPDEAGPDKPIFG